MSDIKTRSEQEHVLLYHQQVLRSQQQEHLPLWLGRQQLLLNVRY